MLQDAGYRDGLDCLGWVYESRTQRPDFKFVIVATDSDHRRSSGSGIFRTQAVQNVHCSRTAPSGFSFFLLCHPKSDSERFLRLRLQQPAYSIHYPASVLFSSDTYPGMNTRNQRSDETMKVSPYIQVLHVYLV